MYTHGCSGTAEVYKLTSRQDVGGCVLIRQGTSGKQQQRDQLESTTSQAVTLQKHVQKAQSAPKKGGTCAGVAQLLVGNDDGMLGQQSHMVHVR